MSRWNQITGGAKALERIVVRDRREQSHRLSAAGDLDRFPGGDAPEQLARALP
jgi:hypothetical protein